MPADRLVEKEMAIILGDENHRINTACALHKPPNNVTNIELINHWMEAGGGKDFLDKIHRGEICV